MAHGTQLTHSQLQRSDLTSGGTDRMAIGMSVDFTHAGAGPVSGSPVTEHIDGSLMQRRGYLCNSRQHYKIGK